MITVYQYEHSPFCIAITRLLRALGTPFETVNLANGNPRQVIELTGGAYYQVPVLLDQTGRAVYESASDSQDVAQYVDKHFAGGRLFPAALDGLQDLLLAHLENEVEGITFRIADPFVVDSIADPVERTLVVRHKERKFGRGCVEQWKQQRGSLLAAAQKVLAPYEKMLLHTPFLLGNTPVYADFLLFGILGNVTYGGHNTLPASLPALSQWEKRLREFCF